MGYVAGKIIACMIALLLLTGCGCELGDFLELQNTAIGLCSSKSMSYVGIKIHGTEHASVVCRTASPIKYYEYPVK